MLKIHRWDRVIKDMQYMNSVQNKKSKLIYKALLFKNQSPHFSNQTKKIITVGYQVKSIKMKNSHIKVPILAILSNQGVKRSLILLVLNLYTFIVCNLQKTNNLCSAKTSRFGFSLTHCSNDLFLLTYHIIYSSLCTRYSLVTLLFPRLLL